MEGEEEQQLTGAVSVIAVPLAEKKLVKKLHKLVKKAAASKLLKRGVKEVVKVLRKADKFKGLCIIAGDLSPIDVISHLPVLCEDHSVPYVFVPSKLGLGSAAATKRPTSCVLIPAGATKPGKGGEAWESEDKLVEAIEEVVGITPSR